MRTAGGWATGRLPALLREVLIDAASGTDTEDEHDEGLVANLVHDSVPADANTEPPG